jgi:type IV pilus assembly protein PilX
MSELTSNGASRQRGMVLVTSLLLLLVVTLLAVAMFRSFGVQEKIAGNVREKQRALNGAASAQQWAEYWLSTGGNALSSEVACSGVVATTWATAAICTNDLHTVVDNGVSAVPWKIGGAPVGFTYNSGTMTASTTGGTDTFYQLPQFYISDLGHSGAGANREIFRIDAWSYGGTTSTVTVIESAYEIVVTSYVP